MRAETNRLLQIERDLQRGNKKMQRFRAGRTGPVRPESLFVPARVHAFTRPVDYDVPGHVPVLAQQKDRDCWAIVTTMKLSWRDQVPYSIEDALASIGDRWVQLYKNDPGLSSEEKPVFLAAAGFVAEPPMNFSVEGWEGLLRNYGPIWVTTDEMPGPLFSIHARLITGIHGDGTPQGTSLTLIDPKGGRVYPERVADFIPKFEEEVATTGHTRIQVVHLPADARSQVTNDENPSVSKALGGQTAVAIAELGYTVIKDVFDNKGDITWHLQGLDGYYHPYTPFWDEAEKRRYGIDREPNRYKKRRVEMYAGMDTLAGAEISAKFGVEFEQNGYFVANVAILPEETNDAFGWALKVTQQIVRDATAYKIDNQEPVAAVKVDFNYRFTSPIYRDQIFNGHFILFGHGEATERRKWTQFGVL